jgi:hypothetical protein
VLVLLLGFGALARPLEPYTPWVLTALPVGTALFVLWQAGQAWDVEQEAEVRGVDRGPWVVVRGMQGRKRLPGKPSHQPRPTSPEPGQKVNA